MAVESVNTYGRLVLDRYIRANNELGDVVITAKFAMSFVGEEGSEV